jgi:hypothetical protein
VFGQDEDEDEVEVEVEAGRPLGRNPRGRGLRITPWTSPT